jgi:Fic/DOC family
VPGPPWEDDPRDLPLIGRNAATLLSSLQAAARTRALPTLADALTWHSALYVGCRVPVAGYVGHLRGDPAVPELVEYEVGVGPLLPDGLPERVGVWSSRVAAEVAALMPKIHAGLHYLDGLLPAGQRPRSVDELHDVVALTAVVHGDWVRIHPFANGNGRTARTWAAFIALRYSLPVFITSKPRPDDIAYARAGRASMGRPPDFLGDHDPAIAVFGHLLSLALLP